MESKLQPIVRPEKGEETANNLPDVNEKRNFIKSSAASSVSFIASM